MLTLKLGLGRHRVLVTQAVREDVLDRLDRFFDVELYEGNCPLTRGELLERLREKAGLMATEHDTIDAAMIAELRSLKAVCNMSAGTGNLDIPALTRAGIMATNTPPGEPGGDPARRAAENLIAAFGFGRIGGRPADLLNPELLCDCCGP